MTQDSKTDAARALHRFGLGPRPGSIAAIASDPRGALLAEVERPGIGRIDDPQMLTSAQAARAAFEARSARRAEQILAQRAEKERQASMGDAAGEEKPKEAKPPPPPPPPPILGPTTIERQNFLKEVKARLDAGIDAEIGFAERLVWFWSNHFCVSAEKVPNMSGGYEREAIRPHILGRYVDMLLSVEGHPAMLVYLDNYVSIGPNSVAGINRTREPRARDPGATYAGRAHRLQPGRRFPFRQGAHRLDHHLGQRQSRAWLGIHLQSPPARARAAAGHRQDL
jgi:uncharacterized protein (DUF1800 family)